ncbi:MAG: hypothetical protein ACYC26_11105 [Phycisphaerales bacterium]
MTFTLFVIRNPKLENLNTRKGFKTMQNVPPPVSKTPTTENPNPETPAKGFEKVNPDADAALVLAQIDENQRLAENNGSLETNVNSKPANKVDKNEAWMYETAENFERDGSGKLVIGTDGKPVRRGGRPRKTQPGDLRAIDLLEGRTTPNATRVEQPRLMLDAGAPDGDVKTVLESDEPVGEEVADVLTDGLFNIVEGVKPSAKPTDAERASIKKAAGKTLGGMRMPWWLVLGAVTAFYLIRVVQTGKQDQKKDGTDGAHGDIRANADRKIDAGQKGSIFDKI